ncbi:MAG TPA: FAD-dependent oxidoreductase [Bacteroidales bacterium]|nr:FAD-dependent oxidoreductase [Bacteroidales bacterium]
MSEKLNIILNGKNVTGYKGETILEMSERLGAEIPTLCHDSRLEPYTSCYLCVVEVQGLRGLQPACSTKINEGMRIDTQNTKIFRARKTALELLLSNHYADCLGPCKQACPAGVDVQGYIGLIEKGKYSDAVALIKETNPLPAICGRVCVRPCELACRRNLMDEDHGVGIDYLKRFASDFDLSSANKYKPKIKPSTGKKIAVVGAGPGGLSAAFFLRKEGHHVDIYEAAPKAGGWLRYGIPEYRLPNDLLQKEVDNITEMGVAIFYNQKLGENLSYQALKYKYDAIILAVGSQAGTNIGCEGDDAGNVFSGVDFLKTMELSGAKYDFSGKTVGVIGGGNTAMDCCRTAKRFGAEKVYVIYRRTEKEMPANPIEIHESKLEGIEYLFLTAPVKVNKDKDGNISSIRCIKMELGEPDSSGRRRPVPVQGSEFDIPMDYALAAIGQKTQVGFLDDVNTHTDIGELKLTKWGDIEADPFTLQTGVKRIFACGDGVTGPATIIQAVAQARVAARSCHQYLSGEAVIPEKKEFISKRDNFKKQVRDDYVSQYEQQHRHEMPTLDPGLRNNFNEVELGYENENVALQEAQRCFECGCAAYYDCKLKKYATDYDADQKKFEGDFSEYNVDFRHPFIEIDNNKCILCSRCVRICRDIVGANAIGLVNRGFKTFVAPSMGDSLQETQCESCGMCISTCPTGAITENVPFKPGPFSTNTFEMICNYCSVGCAIEVRHKNKYVTGVNGVKGKINIYGNICRYARFGYKYFNRPGRIVRPLLKVAGKFEEIDFSEAYNIITYKLKSTEPDRNAFFAGARLTNEEMYLVQKLARKGALTNNISSFHYLGREDGYRNLSDKNVYFEQLADASKIWLFGSEINRDNAVFGFMINNQRRKRQIPVANITVRPYSSMKEKVDENILIRDYYSFVRAVNYYLVKSGKQNMLFINDNCSGFDTYREELLKDDYTALVGQACGDASVIEHFADSFNEQMNAILVISEKELNSATCSEIRNLALITGKLGKTASGIFSLKEKNNAQGLFDMGISPMYGVGHKDVRSKDYQEKICQNWNLPKWPETVSDSIYNLLDQGKLKNIFVFGEDPIGCAMDKALVKKWFNNADFVLVQDYFMTDTAAEADLILPASFPSEIGGSYTNTLKVLQKFEPASEFVAALDENSIQQLIGLNRKFGEERAEDSVDVMMEAISLLPVESASLFEFFNIPVQDKKLFRYGCDILIKQFDEEFEEKLKM